MQKKKVVLVDGNGLLHRAFHAYPYLTTSKGESVNAVYGFAAMLLVVLEKLVPEYLVVVFDEKGPTFRHQQFTQYKATRKPMDEGLSGQIERVRELVRAFAIPMFAINGYEADDIIGTIVHKLRTQNSELRIEKELTEIVIVTGDRDLLQLLDDGVVAMMPGKTFSDEVMVDSKVFEAKYGFSDPKKLIELKALMGDASDNIPGVAGVGEKTAQKLLEQFQSVEGIYEHIDQIEGKLKEKLVNGAEMAVMSKALATIDCDVPLQFDLDACKRDGADIAKVRELFGELEFKSLLGRLDKLNGGKQASLGLDGEEAEKEIELDERAELEKYLAQQPEGVRALDLAMLDVLQRMKQKGVKVDIEMLGALSERLGKKIQEITRAVYEDVGHEFNLNSPKQLSEVMFDELRLPVIRKTKTGRSTNEEVLHELIAAHPMIEKLLQYRELYKLKSTYLDALPKFVLDDGRIHSTFKLDVAATGRLSSIDPNLQNIPIVSAWGSEIRKAFVAPEDYSLLALDYSQIELRILAHLSQDEELMKIFVEGEDVHRTTAAKIFNVEVGQVTKDQRRSAKTINFGLMYGMGSRALSMDLKITYGQAELFIKAYFEAFPKVKKFMDSVIKFGVEYGYVETVLGRRRYLPELKSQDMRLRSAGERMAINMPCQGTQAEMIKRAMVKIDSQIVRDQKSLGELAMILQIHDELIFEVREDQLEKWLPVIKNEMENALPLSVPVEVGVKVGKNWGEMREIS